MLHKNRFMCRLLIFIVSKRSAQINKITIIYISILQIPMHKVKGVSTDRALNQLWKARRQQENLAPILIVRRAKKSRSQKVMIMGKETVMILIQIGLSFLKSAKKQQKSRKDSTLGIVKRLTC